MIAELLKRVCVPLEKSGIPYMISGSLALMVYTVPRFTRDIDIVIDLKFSDIDRFFEIFENDFYIPKSSVQDEVKRRGMFNLIDNKTNYKIDFIVLKWEEFREVEFIRRKRKNIEGLDVWMVSLEDLILSKLIWIQQIQSDMQMRDIENLLTNPEVDMYYVKTWCAKLRLNTFNIFQR